jgi:uncharacterized protein YyaL (SSP411 family)
MNRLLTAVLLMLAFGAHARHDDSPAWMRSDRAAFTEAKVKQRPVILYLEAVWCHWCHVMDQQTYADPEVRALIERHFIALRIDQDLRPDLANRYRDYGWPATIIFAPDGRELAKRQGYVPKAAFADLLRAIRDGASAESLGEEDIVVPAQSAELSVATRERLQLRHRSTFDPRLGGLKAQMKYLDRDQVEYALHLAATGDDEESKRAHKTLTAAAQLIDPVWGGVYQYSTHGDWQHPHYEKLTRLQAEYLRVYALACVQLGEPKFCAHARSIEAYTRDFLRDHQGSYAVSQDADLKPGEHSAGYFALGDSERRRQGMPRIDRSVYAHENGLMIDALVALYEATMDIDLLRRAEQTAERMLSTRALRGGGFAHGDDDEGGPFLGDSVAMGRGFLALYRATAERRWLQQAARTGDFIVQNFRSSRGFDSVVATASPIGAGSNLDEVMATTRFLNLLARYTGSVRHRDAAHHGMRWLAADAVALSRYTESGILLLDVEIAGDPLHLTVRGGKSDTNAKALFLAALKVPGGFRRIEWWDEAEGALMNDDVRYPNLRRAAAFVCTARTCSTPITRPEGIAEYLEPVEP